MKNFLLAQALFLLAIAAPAGAAPAAAPAAAPERIVFGSTPNLGAIPILALKKGFFDAEGLTVEFKKLQTGKLTMDAVISGEVDVGTVVDSNIAFIGFTPNPVRVVSAVATKLDDALYYRTERKIADPKDLVGKSIGYAPATTSHIFLARFLARNGIAWSSVKAVPIQPGSMLAAFRGGTVDAVSIWEPWGENIAAEFGPAAAKFENDASIYPSRVILAATAASVETKTAALVKVVRALRAAERFLRESPEESAAIIAPEVGASVEVMPKILGRYSFRIDLDPELPAQVAEIGIWIHGTMEDFKEIPLPNYAGTFVRTVVERAG